MNDRSKIFGKRLKTFYLDADYIYICHLSARKICSFEYTSHKLKSNINIAKYQEEKFAYE